MSGVDSAPPYSKKIQSLLNEVNAMVDKKIVIHRIPPGPQIRQGETIGTPYSWDITVTSGISPDYDDSVLAHELFHVILNVKGFAGGALPVPGVDAGIPTLNQAQRAQLPQALMLTATTINSCFNDQLIDRETLKRGFQPKLLLDKERDQTLQMAVGFEPNEGDEWPDVIKKGTAVLVFCESHRMSATSSKQYLAALKPKYGKTVFDHEKALEAKFRGQRCQINDPTGCYALTLQLRDTAHLKGVIRLRNPQTHEEQ